MITYQIYRARNRIKESALTKRNRPTLLRELMDLWFARERWDAAMKGIEYPDIAQWLDAAGFKRGSSGNDGVNRFEVWNHDAHDIAIIVPFTPNVGMMERAVSQLLSVMNWDGSDAKA